MKKLKNILIQFLKMKNVVKIIKNLKKYQKNLKEPTIRRTSRTNHNPYKTLITCLLSLRTQDKNTEISSKNLFKVADTPQKVVKLPIKKLEKLIYSSGYYKNKARTIKHVSQVLLDKYQGKVPNDINKLMEIKGIGRKTAAIVMVFAFNNYNYIPCDVHVFVCANRLGWVKEKTPEKTELALMKVVPKKYWHLINTLFVLHGQKICLTRNPKCNICPIEKNCPKIGF